MNCEACGMAFIGNSCGCGWKAPELTVQNTILVRRCICCKKAMIRERVGHTGHAICRWCSVTWEGQLLMREGIQKP